LLTSLDLQCFESLLKKQFINIYCNEIITNKKSNCYNKLHKIDNNNYIFNLDKLCANIFKTIIKIEFLNNYLNSIFETKEQKLKK